MTHSVAAQPTDSSVSTTAPLELVKNHWLVEPKDPSSVRCC